MKAVGHIKIEESVGVKLTLEDNTDGSQSLGVWAEDYIRLASVCAILAENLTGVSNDARVKATQQRIDSETKG